MLYCFKIIKSNYNSQCPVGGTQKQPGQVGVVQFVHEIVEKWLDVCFLNS